MMGSPANEEGRWEGEFLPREAIIDAGFWIFETPCTQALWEAVMGPGTNPSHFIENGASRPVEQVSWKDCQGFLTRLNERLKGLTLGLPSEAQWEYACRAGTRTPRYQENLDEIAWFKKNSEGETHTVGGKAPNAWGLYDMLGNVWEWCSDAARWPDEQPGGPEAADASAPRIIRGGSWSPFPRHARAAYRNGDAPTSRYNNLGFRCAEFRDGP
jgi:formylglycine-generating enzyme required for sulfatase activity